MKFVIGFIFLPLAVFAQIQPVSTPSLYYDTDVLPRIDANFNFLNNASLQLNKANTIASPGNIESSANGQIGATETEEWFPNASSGTTLNSLVSINTSGQVVLASAGTNQAAGVVIDGAGTTGNALVQRTGQAYCTFDGATTLRDLVAPSASINGACTDLGETTYLFTPPNHQIIGRVLSTNVGVGTYVVDFTGFSGASVSMTVPSAAGATALASSNFIYDSTSKNYHLFPNGADGVVATFLSSGLPTNGQVFTATVSAGNIVLTPLTGFSGTKTAGACTLTITSGYITNVTGC